MLTIRHIYISPGHNFVGHHGGPPGTHESIEVSEVQCVQGRGLEGDRYFSRKEGHKGQVTFFSEEVFEDLCTALELTDRDPSKVRRNVVVSGCDLPSLVGVEFEVQGIRFEGVEECKPCYWMDLALASGAEDLMEGRGGLRCRILSSGVLRRDD
ncbi:MAG: molybdenum cofactor biosysynthesis protein [Candidatus Eisenbacteria bacterium]